MLIRSGKVKRKTKKLDTASKATIFPFGSDGISKKKYAP